MPPKITGPHQRLIDEYGTYDEHVDVVSAFEWLFTDPGVKDLPATVQHFERFPRIRGSNGATLTPDFTVLFVDRTAIIGEIAQIALNENSIDKLCKQLANYDALTQVPGPSGLVDVERLDVVQLVQNRVGLNAVRRIIKERLLDPEHWYKPSRPPCIVQYSRTPDVYVLQRIPDPENGTIYTPPARSPNISTYLDNDFAPPIKNFIATKTRRAFINDPIPPLYLATHLWTRTWPTLVGRIATDYTIDPEATVQSLREQYGTGTIGDVKKALALLQTAGVAAAELDGTWTISRRLLGRSGDRDVHEIIARRSVSRVKPLVTSRRSAKPVELQGSLWETDDDTQR